MTTLSPKLVDRYIFRQLLDYFLLGVVVFTLIAFFSDTLLKFIREIQKYGIPFSTMLTMIGLQLPRSIALVLPASSFLAVLMVFNHLNNQFEIIAMRMNGISLWRLMMPALILGVFCSGLAYVLNDYVVPWCNIKTDQMKQQVIRSGTLPANGRSFMFKDFDEQHNLRQLIYISRYHGRELGDSTFIDLSKPNIMQIIQSSAGTWDPNGGWVLKDANIYLVSKDADHSSAGHSETYTLRGLINDRKAQEKQIEKQRRKATGVDVDTLQQNFSEVWTTIKRREALKMKVPRSNYINMWAKITWPLGCLAIILSAVPLSMSPPRQGSNRGFLYAIIVLFLFYQLNSIFQNLGRIFFYDFGGLLTLPVYLTILSWAPLVIMTTIGLLLIRRKSQVL